MASPSISLAAISDLVGPVFLRREQRCALLGKWLVTVDVAMLRMRVTASDGVMTWERVARRAKRSLEWVGEWERAPRRPAAEEG